MGTYELWTVSTDSALESNGNSDLHDGVNNI